MTTAGQHMNPNYPLAGWHTPGWVWRVTGSTTTTPPPPATSVECIVCGLAERLAMTTMPDPTHSLPKASLVAYCASGHVYYPFDWVGFSCECCGYERHILRRRRVYICPDCDEEDNAFATKEDYRAHTHD